MSLKSAIVAVLILLVTASPILAAPSSRVERAGSIGLGIGGGYGVITGDSRYGTDFDDGFGLDVVLKYVVNPHWSLGLSFQSQIYESTTLAFNTQQVDDLRFTTFRGDVYYYRDRAASASQYLVLGLGIYRPETHYASEANVGFPGESAEVSLGLGGEIFIGETWGIDLGGRAFGYFGDGFSAEEEARSGFEPTGSDFSIAFRGQAVLFFYLVR